MTTLTYVYADRAAVVGPLALVAEPGSYDLCAPHSDALSTPKGWELIRLPLDTDAAPEPHRDDLLALADAVREVGLTWDDPVETSGPQLAPPAAPSSPSSAPSPGEGRRRGHLWVVADPPDEV